MLTFNLKYIYYDMVKEGKKTHEYRPVNYYWNIRICKLKIGYPIKLVKGYTDKAMIGIVSNYNFICREDLPEYAKDFFKDHLKFFHDIEFRVLRSKNI